jgi:hypothetical protein
MPVEQSFDARNDLERQLVAAHEGRLDGAAFIRELIGSQVFMPVLEDNHGIQGFQRSDKATPLTVEEEGGTRVLVVFTSPERAKPFVGHFPGYEKGGLLTDFSWILERLGAGLGISVNPGWEVGMDFDPEMVAALINQAQEAQASSASS